MTRAPLYLNEMHMDELEDPSDLILFLPVGISEGHGAHLPIGTDTIQIEYVTEKIAEELGEKVVIAPTVNYGYCRATRSLPGSLSVSFDTVRNVVYDVLKHASEQGFDNAAVLSGHSGRSHMMALRLACQDIVDEESMNVMLMSDYDLAYELKGEEIPEGDGHGGEIETARVLDISPELVKDERPSEDVERSRYEISSEPGGHFSQGVIGDPNPATSDEGEDINEYVIEKMVEEIKDTFSDLLTKE